MVTGCICQRCRRTQILPLTRDPFNDLVVHGSRILSYLHHVANSTTPCSGACQSPHHPRGCANRLTTPERMPTPPHLLHIGVDSFQIWRPFPNRARRLLRESRAAEDRPPCQVVVDSREPHPSWRGSQFNQFSWTSKAIV